MTLPRPRPRAAQGGFTMVEAIVVIVIIGIIGAIVAVFIRSPIQGYVDAVARAEATDDADLALRRMARDIRLALPNSVRVSADGRNIEFLLTTTGGRYLAADDGAVAGAGVPLDFDNVDNRSFSVVGQLTQPINAGDYIVVFNLGPGTGQADAYQFNAAGTGRNIARVRTGAAAGTRAPIITLVENPFALQAEPMPSPSRRFQVVSGPVSYRCEGTAPNFVLRRYEGYDIAVGISATPPIGGRASVMAARVANCNNVFLYNNSVTAEDSVQLRTNGLVILTLALRTRNQQDPAVRLVHQVHVDNMP